MTRGLLRRAIAYRMGAFDDSRCPYDCPTHREAWLRRYPRRGF